MKPSGLHLLLTYKCNASCGHCFLSCSPQQKGTMSAEEANGYIDQAAKIPYINHLFIEGGEPFLYPDTVRTIIKRATDKGFWIGLLSNGFWAANDEKAREVLAPLIEAGLTNLDISTDAWHSEFVPLERAERAARVAQELGVEAELMVCAGGVNESSVLTKLKTDGFDISPSGIVCKGRASTSDICTMEKVPWEKLTSCGVKFGGGSRVHIGPYGGIHICQGLLAKGDARVKPLKKIFKTFNLKGQPICAALDRGGPAELAGLAKEYGFEVKDAYADGCQLCFETRCHLQKFFPDEIGPPGIFKSNAA